jgi:hypothetical protein
MFDNGNDQGTDGWDNSQMGRRSGYILGWRSAGHMIPPYQDLGYDIDL